MKAKQLGLSDYMHHGAAIKDWFEQTAAQSSGEFDAATLEAFIQQGRHICWGWYEDSTEELVGIVVTAVIQYSEYNCLAIVGGAGKVGDYSDLDQVFNALAAQAQCQRYELRGRKGFVKKMKAQGWREKYTVMEKAVVIRKPTPLLKPVQENENGSDEVPGTTEVSAGD